MWSSKRASCLIVRHASTKSSSTSDHCLQLVKKRDYEGFLASLLLPHCARQSALAIRAFNVETSNISEAVKDRTIGLMRIQFWKDSIAAMGEKNPPGQPVVIELDRAVRKHSLSKDLLVRIVTGRQAFLSDKPFDTLDDVESYGQDCFASLHNLVLQCLNDPSSEGDSVMNGHARHAARQLGMAQALVTLLRGVPYNAAKRKVFLPAALMSSHGVSAEKVIRGKAGEDEGMKLVVETIASRAQEHLENCRFRAKYLDGRQKSVLLPAVGVDAYLYALSEAKCDVFDARLQKTSPWMPISMCYHRFRQTF